VPTDGEGTAPTSGNDDHKHRVELNGYVYYDVEVIDEMVSVLRVVNEGASFELTLEAESEGLCGWCKRTGKTARRQFIKWCYTLDPSCSFLWNTA
jgi:hypothetical protein